MRMLTDAKIRAAKPTDRDSKLTDSGGLFLHVTKAGGKIWRWRYEMAGREKLLTIGHYPEVTLAAARTARDDAKAIKRTGRDPAVEKKIAREQVATNDATTFRLIAEEWHALNKKRWVARHADDVIDSLREFVFPVIGDLPIRDVPTSLVLRIVRDIEARPAIETARRVRQRISAVFQYAVATDRADSDPATPVKGALAPLKKGRQPAIIDLDEARIMLRQAEAVPAHPTTKLALRLLALTALRPGTLITTPWVELNRAGNGVWTVPAARMKLKLENKEDEKFDHLVPLSRQAIEVIDVLRRVTGGGEYAFPNTRHAHKPLSENAIGYLLNRAGYHHRHVPHGWRATFSTVMNERHPADRAIIDLMLAHKNKNAVEGAYNRAAHLQRRTELAQLWADLILADAKRAIELLGERRR